MLPLVLDELVSQAVNVWSLPPLKWSPSEPTAEEEAMIEKETRPNEFDKFGLKAGMVDAWKRGECKRVCVECGLGRVIAFTTGHIPLEFWGRVLQWFGAGRGKWRVIWFASEAVRCFPDAGKEMGPEHVNGGYTMSCSTSGIFIYRKEEASRVLIHELMHAACLDEKEWSIPDREAMVETWAELILVALLSKGDVKKAEAMWKKQAQWVADSNHRALNKNGVEDASDYAWRYLVGRDGMYGRLGVEIPAPRPHSKSSRFTHPDLEPIR
jgi:hypothetical protein